MANKELQDFAEKIKQCVRLRMNIQSGKQLGGNVIAYIDEELDALVSEVEK